MEKSPFIKKSPKIKSYQFETLFSRTFFLAPVWFYTKKSSEKKSYNKWKCMIHNSRFFFSSDLFSSGLFSRDLISKDFTGSPHTILGKKVPGIQNTGLYFQWHFFQGLDKIRTFFPKFLFPGFFPENFFPGTFLHRFYFTYLNSSLKTNQRGVWRKKKSTLGVENDFNSFVGFNLRHWNVSVQIL